MRKTIVAAALAASFSLLSLPALSADNGIYLGASVGQSSVQYDDNIGGENFNFDASATGFKAIAGWRFIDWLAVEANYVDLGSGDDNVLGKGLKPTSMASRCRRWVSCPSVRWTCSRAWAPSTGMRISRRRASA